MLDVKVFACISIGGVFPFVLVNKLASALKDLGEGRSALQSKYKGDNLCSGSRVRKKVGGYVINVNSRLLTSD